MPAGDPRPGDPVEPDGGAGPLSPEARARLARGVDEHLALPDLADHAAVAEWRAAVHRAWGEGTEPGEPEHRPVTVAGVPCLEAGPGTAPPLLYLHGGGYALGSAGVAAPITARLAAHLRVVSVDYRLAPEHPYPAALDDALAVYRELAGGGGPVAAGGDSAGGGLAVALALALRASEERPPLPSALLLLSPHLDHAAGGRDDEPVRRLAAAYRGAIPADDPRVSPLRADLRGLPPTLVQTGTADPLLPQAVRFARRCRMAGVDVTLDAWDGLWHTWHYHRELPEAHRALAEASRFLLLAAAHRA